MSSSKKKKNKKDKVIKKRKGTTVTLKDGTIVKDGTTVIFKDGTTVNLEDKTKKSKKSTASSKIAKEVVNELSKIAKLQKGEKKYGVTDREKELLKKYAGTKVMGYVMMEIIPRIKIYRKGRYLINAVRFYLKNSEIRGYLQDEYRTNFAQYVAILGDPQLLRLVARYDIKSIYHTNILNKNLLYFACDAQNSRMIKFILRKYPKVSPVLETTTGCKPFERLIPETLEKHPEFKRYLEMTTEDYSSSTDTGSCTSHTSHASQTSRVSRASQVSFKSDVSLIETSCTCTSHSGAVSGASSATSVKSVSEIATSCTSHSG